MLRQAQVSVHEPSLRHRRCVFKITTPIACYLFRVRHLVALSEWLFALQNAMCPPAAPNQTNSGLPRNTPAYYASADAVLFDLERVVNGALIALTPSHSPPPPSPNPHWQALANFQALVQTTTPKALLSCMYQTAVQRDASAAASALVPAADSKERDKPKDKYKPSEVGTAVLRAHYNHVLFCVEVELYRNLHIMGGVDYRVTVFERMMGNCLPALCFVYRSAAAELDV